ncbi:PepSY-associated TM helix domain-containing protein [Amycolatopsis jiangsuensis]|uniref:Putative iron-regulated membrane protein n=1 Tax=Amycolatopsis jiangsuensis TaxID=1181879 RepID=A0A840IPR6_9PSEU|nr:PepSY domain-containing protein [Amycolatopsis jiangsuensis]MBB4683168.1 putative iron-regulated membrane protein [Amycolatopsis jiangsuensis]
MATPTTGRSPDPPEESPLASKRASADLPSAAKSRSGLGLLARRVHFLAGLAVAPFLVVMCLTGLANACTPQIVDALYGPQLFADSVTGAPRPASGQVAAAMAAHPDGTVKEVIPPADRDRTTRIVLSVPGLPDLDTFSGEDLTVYVNPYTNHVQGELVTVKDRPPAQVWLRNLHGNLGLGSPGRLYSEFATSWLPVIVLFGFVLWVVQRRSRGERGGPAGSRRSSSRQARLRSLHGRLGVFLGVGLVALAITGFSQSDYVGDRVDQLLETLSSAEPHLEAGKVAVPQGAEQITVEQVLATAGATGLRGELTMTPPGGQGEVWKVAETGTGWPVRHDSIAVDPYTAEVTERVAFDDYPLPAKLDFLGVQAHGGTLFGIANQIVVSLLAVGALVLIAVAYRMWWVRRPRAALWPPAPPPVWRSLSRTESLAVVLINGILVWAIPILVLQPDFVIGAGGGGAWRWVRPTVDHGWLCGLPKIA